MWHWISHIFDSPSTPPSLPPLFLPSPLPSLSPPSIHLPSPSLHLLHVHRSYTTYWLSRYLWTVHPYISPSPLLYLACISVPIVLCSVIVQYPPHCVRTIQWLHSRCESVHLFVWVKGWNCYLCMVRALLFLISSSLTFLDPSFICHYLPPPPSLLPPFPPSVPLFASPSSMLTSCSC